MNEDMIMEEEINETKGTEGEKTIQQESVNIEQDPSIIKWQLDPTDVLDIFENSLRGIVPRGDKWYQLPGSKPVMNEKGIMALMSTIRAHINKNTYLTNIPDEDMILKLCHQLHIDLLCEFCGEKTREYEVDLSAAEKAVDTAVNIIYFSLMRAWKEGERRSLTKREKISETKVVGSSQGRLSRILPF